MDAHDIDTLLEDSQASGDAFGRTWDDRDIAQPYAVALAFAVLASLVALAFTSVTATIGFGIWRLFN